MPITPEMEAEVAAVRKQVHDILAKAQERSQKSGKPLLIMVGEEHYSPNSALLEAIIYQEARQFGIKDVAFEYPSMGKEGKKWQKIAEEAPISRSATYGHTLIFHQAKYFNDTPHFVDGRHSAGLDLEHPALDYRNETIAANLGLIKKPVMLLTGDGHLDGLEDLIQKQKTHEYITFVASPYTFRMKHKDPSGNYVFTALSFKANMLSNDDFLALGMGKERAADFIKWAENKGLKRTPEEIEKAVQANIDPKELSHKQTLSLINSLYELGRDKEAGKVAAISTVEFGTDPNEQLKIFSKRNRSMDFINAYADTYEKMIAAKPEVAAPENWRIPMAYTPPTFDTLLTQFNAEQSAAKIPYIDSPTPSQFVPKQVQPAPPEPSPIPSSNRR